MTLIEQHIDASDQPLSQRAISLIKAGRKRFDDIECFGFVPSDYEKVWSILAGLDPASVSTDGNTGRFVEWGSGLGIVTALAEMLGFDATGVELETELVNKSQQLLSEFELTATIEQGDYLLSQARGEIYFAYCWPGQMNATQKRFAAIANPTDKLLICEAQSDIRCRVLG